MRLFEGGILDKITNDEYEKMFQQQTAAIQVSEPGDNEKKAATDNNEDREITESTEVDKNDKRKKESSEKELKALSLQMLQGAFYLLIFGYLMAFLAFIFEMGHYRMGGRLKLKFRTAFSQLSRQFYQLRMRIDRFI